ncbi:hypothetical protein QYM36_010399 [Artemia franciscana]|uniref:Tetraspanin n=1 Tax=Artemia franciscana TaxID=6661 RepID=A0AA88I5R5_ARTSF|nr:hypothetical protein QYM36_010399 [Artemia franciscana]
MKFNEKIAIENFTKIVCYTSLILLAIGALLTFVLPWNAGISGSTIWNFCGLQLVFLFCASIIMIPAIYRAKIKSNVKYFCLVLSVVYLALTVWNTNVLMGNDVLEDTIINTYRKSIEKMDTKWHSSVINDMHTTLECCGMDSHKGAVRLDFNILNPSFKPKEVPPSCCFSTKTGLKNEADDLYDYQTGGCQIDGQKEYLFPCGEQLRIAIALNNNTIIAIRMLFLIGLLGASVSLLINGCIQCSKWNTERGFYRFN